MRIKQWWMAPLLTFLMIGILMSEDSPIISPGASLVRLSTGPSGSDRFIFTEGPAVDAWGNVFFTDQPNNRILKWSVDGVLSTFLQPCGRANGMYFDRRGNLIACADEKNELWAIDPSGGTTVLVDNYGGKLLNGPNDLWISPNDGFFLTDPFYVRSYWTRSPLMEQDGQCVYYLSPDRRTLKRVAEELIQPNGIVGTPDGKVLYVADIGNNVTYAYDVLLDGALSNRRIFCLSGSDGMTIDNEGNVYLTGNGVTVFNSAGIQIEQISVPENWTGNVCFGGADRRSLFITASTGLYTLRMRVRGVDIITRRMQYQHPPTSNLRTERPLP
jgi:gluconolactonase